MTNETLINETLTNEKVEAPSVENIPPMVNIQEIEEATTGKENLRDRYGKLGSSDFYEFTKEKKEVFYKTKPRGRQEGSEIGQYQKVADGFSLKVDVRKELEKFFYKEKSKLKTRARLAALEEITGGFVDDFGGYLEEMETQDNKYTKWGRLMEDYFYKYALRRSEKIAREVVYTKGNDLICHIDFLEEGKVIYELKSVKPEKYFEYFYSENLLKKRYEAQVQFQFWLSGLKDGYLVVFNPFFGKLAYRKIKVVRDEEFIEQIKILADFFIKEKARVVSDFKGSYLKMSTESIREAI